MREPSRTLYSFDVFDTALVRSIALPTDVFRLTAQSIFSGFANAIDLEEEFFAVRVEAERIARDKAAPKEDCTLQDIWREIRFLMPHLPAWASFETEIDAERGCISGNPDLEHHIKSLHAAGHRVIFVSDIYHSKQTVFEFLRTAKLADSLDQIYVSSEIGLLKSSGNLFAYVANAEGTDPASIVHVGDNPHSDVKVARDSGLRARLYTKTRLNKLEVKILAEYSSDLVGSRLAGIMRLMRLSSSSSEIGSLVSALLGPLAVLLASWSLQEAVRRGVSRVYFIARDGYVPFCAARKFAAAFPTVEIRYARLSRHSLVAAMPTLGDFGVFWMQHSWSNLTLAQIAELVGCDWKDMEQQLLLAMPHVGPNHVLQNIDEIRRFVHFLDTVEISVPARHNRETRRNAALQYMRAQGLLDATPFMLFDVGWYLNMQAALKAVLDSENLTSFAGGLYLGLRIGRVSSALSGPARGLFNERPHTTEAVRNGEVVFDRVILIEHLLGLAPHGSAKGYEIDDLGEPVVRASPISPDRAVIARKTGEAVSVFATHIAPYAAQLGDESTIRRVVEMLLSEVFQHPEAYDLGSLSRIDVESDSGSGERWSVAEPWRAKSIVLQLVPYRVRTKLGLSHGPTLWPEASLAATSRPYRMCLKSIRQARATLARVLRSNT